MDQPNEAPTTRLLNEHGLPCDPSTANVDIPMQAGMVEGSRDDRLRTTPLKTYSLTLGGFARYALGIVLLLTTVFLWTASQFLASVCSLRRKDVVPPLLTIPDYFRGQYIF